MPKPTNAMQKCILTGEPLTLDTDSRAHIIPSALGGNLRPTGILSMRGNALLNERVDAPLVRALAPIMALVGGRRDRGEAPPVPLRTASGDTYLARHGDRLELAKPILSETVDADRITVTVRGRSAAQVLGLLGHAMKARPDATVVGPPPVPEVHDGYLAEVLHSELSVGPDPVFPAAYVMASLYACSLGQPAHVQLAPYVHSLPDRGSHARERRAAGRGLVSMPPDTFYWMPEPSPVAHGPGLWHVLAYFGDPQRQGAMVYVELFGLPGVAVLLPFSGSNRVQATYCIDVLSGSRFEPSLHQDAFDALWRQTHTVAGDCDFFKPALGRILSVIAARSREAEIERIVREEWPMDGQATDETVGRISRRVAEMAVASMRRNRL